MGRAWSIALALAALFAAGQTAAQTQTPLPLRAVGRTTAGDGGLTLLQWPGVYFEGAFRGSEVTVGPVAGKARFRIEIDNVEMGVIASGGLPVRITGLTPTAHRLRVERLDEQREIVAGFAGAFVPSPHDVLPPPPPRRRQIEFIGDSFTAGFGLTARRQLCSDKQVWATTDTSQTFAGLLGRRYDADYQVIAYSGGGLVRNFPFQMSKPVVPAIYDRVLFQDPRPAPEDPAWRPQLVVLSLGSNDFAPIDLREKWRSPADIRAAFVPAGVAFVQRLRARYPEAKILILDFNEAPVVMSNRLLMTALEDAGVTGVRYASTRDRFAFSGCFAHLDAKDNLKIADQLQELIDGWAEVWGPEAAK